MSGSWRHRPRHAARLGISRLLAIGILASLPAAPARAQVLGSIFSGTTDGDGASLYFNPAAMSLVPRSRLELSLIGGLAEVGYTRSGTDPQTGQAYREARLLGPGVGPLLALVVDRLWPKRLRLGLTASIPQAGGAAWPERITDEDGARLGPTRYHALSGLSLNVYTQLGASVRLHRVVAIGVAVNLVASYLSARKHLDLLNQGTVTALVPCASNPGGCENPAFSTPLELSGAGFSAGASAGVLITPIPQLQLGLSYQSPVKVPLAVKTQVDTAALERLARDYLPGLEPLGVSGEGQVTLTLPQRIHLGARAALTERVELALELRWANYAATEITTGRITRTTSALLPEAITLVAPRTDEWKVLARLAVQASPRWRLGGLVTVNTAIVPDAYLTPAVADFMAVLLAVGARVALRPSVDLSTSVTAIFGVPREITASAYGNDHPEPFNLPAASGRYTAFAQRLELGVAYKF